MRAPYGTASVQNRIALSEQQKTRLREILADGGKEANAAYRAVTEKLLGNITAAQRQKIARTQSEWPVVGRKVDQSEARRHTFTCAFGRWQ